MHKYRFRKPCRGVGNPRGLRRFGVGGKKSVLIEGFPFRKKRILSGFVECEIRKTGAY
jgi:hypothetical protein